MTTISDMRKELKMSHKLSKFFAAVLVLGLGLAHAQTTATCPGFNPKHNTNLACELATAIKPQVQSISAAGQGSSFSASLDASAVSASLAAQLSTLPIATAVSGSGFTLGKGFGGESLGTILTQRGETIGRHKRFFAFNYQHFGFGSVDGIRFKNFNSVTVADFGAAVGKSYVVSTNAVDLSVDQYTVVGSFGLTDRLDFNVIVPFSTVNLTTRAVPVQFNAPTGGSPSVAQPAPPPINLPGSATGIGDVIFSGKWNAIKGIGNSEGTSIAVGSELRIPTGEEKNYLGSGAYGVKPYAILSHRGKKFTPNINVGYQWNSKSALYTYPNTSIERNLPGSFLYSGGVDMRVTKRLTLVGEFLGQYVIDGPRLTRSTVSVPVKDGSVAPCPFSGNTLTCSTITSGTHSSYAMDNGGVGFKLNPFKGLLLNASAVFKLDDAGLRAKVVPLFGASYRF